MEDLMTRIIWTPLFFRLESFSTFKLYDQLRLWCVWLILPTREHAMSTARNLGDAGLCHLKLMVLLVRRQAQAAQPRIRGER